MLPCCCNKTYRAPAESIVFFLLPPSDTNSGHKPFPVRTLHVDNQQTCSARFLRVRGTSKEYHGEEHQQTTQPSLPRRALREPLAEPGRDWGGSWRATSVWGDGEAKKRDIADVFSETSTKQPRQGPQKRANRRPGKDRGDIYGSDARVHALQRNHEHSRAVTPGKLSD